MKRGKNDAADAEALCEAMSRPTMRFVPVKSPQQQAALMLMGMRERLVRTATALLQHVRTGRGKNAAPWLLEMLKRKPPQLVAGHMGASD